MGGDARFSAASSGSHARLAHTTAAMAPVVKKSQKGKKGGKAAASPKASPAMSPKASPKAAPAANAPTKAAPCPPPSAEEKDAYTKKAIAAIKKGPAPPRARCIVGGPPITGR